MKTDKTPAFTMPPLDEIYNMSAMTVGDQVLLPTDNVICINRGRATLHETFDGQHREIPPGYFRTEYGAALHFRRRLLVKGTRNLEQGGYVSWIGILGSEDGRIKVDDERDCERFTDEDLQSYGEKIEGIDRSSFSDPSDREVTAIRMQTARAAAGGQGAGTRPFIETKAQATEGAREAAAEVFAPPAESATREAEAEAAAESAAPARTGRARAR